jgi:beta-glucosidase
VLLLAIVLFAAAQGSNLQYQDSSIPAEERASDLVSRMTLEEKVSQMQNTAPAIPRLNIPAYDWWNEALHGVARAGLATVFPQAIGLAATWDTDLEFRIADAISTEGRAKYNDAIAHNNHRRYYGLTFWSPNINIFRDPRWGRGQETYGEDPFLTAQMAVQFIRGMQGNDPHYFKTMATSKHFAVHSGPERSRHEFNVDADEQDLRNTYLYAFEQTVKLANVQSLMCAYNSVDGVPACASDMLLKKNLRDGWNFKGYVVSDCGAIDDVYKGHKYAKSAAQAAAVSVKAGTDLECGGVYKNLVDAVHQGLISEGEINRSVQRLFAARFRLGMFDPPERVPYSKLGVQEIASQAHQKIALEAAEKSIVLLKNENNLLPLEKTPQSIAVIGPAADDPDTLLGNYYGIPSHIVTPLQGIEQKFGSRSEIQFSLGSNYVSGGTALIPQNVLTSADQGGKQGLLAEYFGNENFQGKPQLSRVEPRGRFDWEMQEPAVVQTVAHDRYSLRWSGYLQINQTGEYKLGLLRAECHTCGRTDTGRLYVDGRLLVADTEKPGERMDPKTEPIQLEAGKRYQVRVDYAQSGGGGGIELVWTPPENAALQDAIETANKADLVLLCMGLNSHLEGEEAKVAIPGFDGGDRTDIELPEPQRKLLQAMLRTGKPTVVVLVNGSALAVKAAKAGAQAIVESWYGGQEAGTALANVLSGDSNPAGRLPVTFYETVQQLPAFTDYSMKNRTYRYFTGNVLYPFGYGLSYAHFHYSDLKVEDGADKTLQITATVRNTSSRDGDEVAQVYFSDRQGARPELKGFQRIHLRADESKIVQFTIDQADRQNRSVSVGSGQPQKQWTESFVQQTNPSR